MHLHSIYLTPSNVQNDITERIKSNIDSFKSVYPEADHHIYSNDDCRSFIKEHFDDDVLSSYDNLIPFAYKADLMRYCLLYELGGIYADLPIHFFHPVEFSDFGKNLVVFRDGFSRVPWIVSTSLIAAQPRLHVFEECIKQICENVRSSFFGENALCPTGPNLFGRKIALTTEIKDFSCGEAVRINKSQSHSYAYLDEHGDVLAVNVKRGVGLTSIGVSHNDNYNKHYQSGRIYAHQSEIMRTWKCENYRDKGWIVQNSSGEFKKGIAIFGPYVDLDKGSYVAKFLFEEKDLIELIRAGYSIDVCSDFGENNVSCSTPRIDPSEDGKSWISVGFDLHSDAEKVEVRIHVHENCIFSFSCFALENIR